MPECSCSFLLGEVAQPAQILNAEVKAFFEQNPSLLQLPIQTFLLRMAEKEGINGQCPRAKISQPLPNNVAEGICHECRISVGASLGHLSPVYSQDPQIQEAFFHTMRQKIIADLRTNCVLSDPSVHQTHTHIIHSNDYHRGGKIHSPTHVPSPLSIPERNLQPKNTPSIALTHPHTLEQIREWLLHNAQTLPPHTSLPHQSKTQPVTSNTDTKPLSVSCPLQPDYVKRPPNPTFAQGEIPQGMIVNITA